MKVMTNIHSPLVSVCMITYNQENFIHLAIESVLKQICNFPFELVIGEDNGDDNTLGVCNEYAKYSSQIRIFPSRCNIGVVSNLVRTLQECRGKYIALCEGDDYWTDPYKLQKQVDFLEANPDYAMVASDIILVDEAGNQIPDNEMIVKQKTFNRSDVTYFDLLQANLVNTLTVVVKNDIMRKLVAEVVRGNLSFTIDKWYWLNIAINYKIRLLADKTAAYRVHTAGISHKSEYMDSRMPLIRHDVIRKFILNHNLYTINEADLSILSKSCLNLILFRKLSLEKRLDILWLVFAHPVLLKNSMNFTAERIRKRLNCFTWLQL
jgi:glycosyltransferase involved in cell wall biosynthesis